MERSCVLRAAKCVLMAAVIITTSSLYAGTKTDCILHEENPVNLYSDALLSMPENTASRENILPLSPVNNGTGYMNGILLAQGKGGAQTAKKKSPGERPSGKTGGNISLSVMAAYIMPMGDLSKLFDYGYGGTIGLSFNDVFAKGLAPGIETGYLYFAGKDDTVGSEYILPFFAVVKYKFNISKNMKISPMLAAGGGYFNITYKPAGSSGKTKSEFESMAKAGLSASYNLTGSFALEAATEYCMIFEKDGRLPFVLLQLGLNYNF